jgi:hypothetical protein
LGRGTEYFDMPLIRSIVRDAQRNNDRFSALVLGVVKSEPFQMNGKLQITAKPGEVKPNQERAAAESHRPELESKVADLNRNKQEIHN